MAAIGLGRAKVEPLLKAGVVLACENSNASVTISGDQAALDETMKAILEAYPSSFVRRLQVPMGYHSRKKQPSPPFFPPFFSRFLLLSSEPLIPVAHLTANTDVGKKRPHGNYSKPL